MAGGPKGRGSKPAKSSATVLETPTSPSAGHPVLCLRHTRNGYGVAELSEQQRSELLLKWAKRTQFTWTELGTQPKHGLGFEYMPAGQIKKAAPEALAQQKYMILRHHQNLPMVGFKVNDTFHVLWIEASYGDVYDHG